MQEKGRPATPSELSFVVDVPKDPGLPLNPEKESLHSSNLVHEAIPFQQLSTLRLLMVHLGYFDILSLLPPHQFCLIKRGFDALFGDDGRGSLIPSPDVIFGLKRPTPSDDCFD